jgi:hypothetical protein
MISVIWDVSFCSLPAPHSAWEKFTFSVNSEGTGVKVRPNLEQLPPARVTSHLIKQRLS